MHHQRGYIKRIVSTSGTEHNLTKARERTLSIREIKKVENKARNMPITSERKFRIFFLLLLALILSPNKLSEARDTTSVNMRLPFDATAEVQNICLSSSARNPTVYQLCRLLSYCSGSPRNQHGQSMLAKATSMMPRTPRSLVSDFQQISNALDDGSSGLVGDMMEAAALGSDAPAWASPRFGEWQPMRGKRGETNV